MQDGEIKSSILDSFSQVDREQADALLAEEAARSRRKIVVLDDDPTGVQTVHGVSVYTDWSVESIREALPRRTSCFHPHQLPRLHGGADHTGAPGDRGSGWTRWRRKPAGIT